MPTPQEGRSAIAFPQNQAIAPLPPFQKPRERTHQTICNTQEIINFMAQSFWQNLFIFKGAIAAKAITAAKDFGYDEKKMRSPSVG